MPLTVIRITLALSALVKSWDTWQTLQRIQRPDRVAFPMVFDLPDTWIDPLLMIWLVSAGAFLWFSWAGLPLAIAMFLSLWIDQQTYSNHVYFLALAIGLTSLQATTLLKWHVSIVYAFSALSKLNLAFLSGAVMALSLHPIIPRGWRIWWIMAVLSWVAIAVEGALAVGLWLPRWRESLVIVGLLLHVTMPLALGLTPELIVFNVAAVSLYGLFIDWTQARVTLHYDDTQIEIHKLSWAPTTTTFSCCATRRPAAYSEVNPATQEGHDPIHPRA